MDSDGATNVTIGLAWAWHALTPGLPLTQAAAASTDLNKIIILMTDGENTQNRWSTFTPSTIDARTALVCANIKATNIKLYTIRVLDGNATLLKNCATNPNMYFNVEVASEQWVQRNCSEPVQPVHREIVSWINKKNIRPGFSRAFLVGNA